jgi:hypothetical protein
MAKSRFFPSVSMCGSASRRLPWSTGSQLPRRKPRRRGVEQQPIEDGWRQVHIVFVPNEFGTAELTVQLSAGLGSEQYQLRKSFDRVIVGPLATLGS